MNIGFNTFQKLNDSADEHLDALLDTITALEKETEKKCEADIITWRGMMTKVSITCRNIEACGRCSDPYKQILTAPFDMMNGYTIPMNLFHGLLLTLLGDPASK